LVPDYIMAGGLFPKLVAKWVAVGLTFFVVGRLTSRRADFGMAATGLVIAVAAIGVRGLMLFGPEHDAYVNPMRHVASRNAFAVWAGCAFAMGIPELLVEKISRYRQILLGFGLVVIAVPLILTLSRGGWPILALALIPLLRRMNLRAAIFTAIAAFTILRVVESYGFGERLERRYADLREGTQSDERRLELIEQGMRLFLDNPIWGVGISLVPDYLADPVFGPTESHNQLIDLLAGTGVLGTGAFLIVGSRIVWNRRRAVQAGIEKVAPEVTNIPLMMIGLLIVTGATSNEVFFCPAFIFALSAANGLLCSVASAAGHSKTSTASPLLAVSAGKGPR
jgi:O-antigen ligase